MQEYCYNVANDDGGYYDILRSKHTALHINLSALASMNTPSYSTPSLLETLSLYFIDQRVYPRWLHHSI